MRFYARGPVARAALTLAVTGRKASLRNPAIDTAWTTVEGVQRLRAALTALSVLILDKAKPA